MLTRVCGRPERFAHLLQIDRGFVYHLQSRCLPQPSCPLVQRLGHLPLEQAIGVRIPGGQPTLENCGFLAIIPANTLNSEEFCGFEILRSAPTEIPSGKRIVRTRRRWSSFAVRHTCGMSTSASSQNCKNASLFALAESRARSSFSVSLISRENSAFPSS
jgi:hypothetical protein